MDGVQALAADPFFAPLMGQEQAVALLSQAIARQRIAPAYLFAGPDGVGRRLAAQCFAQRLFSIDRANFDRANFDRPNSDRANRDRPNSDRANREHPTTTPDPVLVRRIAEGNHPDWLWVEPTYLHQGKLLTVSEAQEAGLKRRGSPQIRLEQVREVGRFARRAPLAAPRSLIVIEAADTMAEAAANGLLKTLEEPGQTTLILLAPGAETLLPTLVSRCARIPFRRLSHAQMQAVLTQAGHPEVADDRTLLDIAQGSPGAAIAHGQQRQAMPADLLDRLDRPPTSLYDALDLARAIDRERDADQQLWLIDYLQQRYWHQWAETGAPLVPHTAPWGDRLCRRLDRARAQLNNYVQPRLVWETTLLDLADH